MAKKASTPGVSDKSTKSSKGSTPEPSYIKKIRDAYNGKKILLYYPVYINTFALAHILEKHKLGEKPRLFNWSDIVPADLIKTLKDKKHDIIYCFSSTDKEDIFRSEVWKVIQENKLSYKVSNPISSFPEQEKLGVEADIDYSNFSLKYLFFQSKVNIEHIHKLGNKYFESHRTKNPYLSKLLSILLARGYQTIHIDTDIQDESKGLLRKLLHEEFGFKFKLTPNLPEYKANNTLLVETKGGQQSFEEIKRQALKDGNASDLKTFVVPDKIKYTSKTKLIAIYKEEYGASQRANQEALRDSIIELSKRIFGKDQTKLFDDNIPDEFLIKNVHFITKSIMHPDDTYSDEKYEIVKKTSSFLQSLKLYNVSEEKIKKEIKVNIKNKTDEQSCAICNLCTIVKSDTQYLQIDSKDNFITCLNDHHVSTEEDITRLELIKTFDNDFVKFSKTLYNKYHSKIEKKKIIKNGLFLLKLVLQNPDGIPKDFIESPEKQTKFIASQKDKKKEFIDSIEKCSSELNSSEFSESYNSLRIIAEDLNYLIVDEQLLCDPKIIFNIFDDFDISEFEYLYSIEFSKKYLQYKP